jgi:hypothetical protein
MAEKDLSGVKVAIVLTNDFEQVEMTEPRKALEDAGAKTTIISPKPGTVQGFKHDVKADTFPVDMTLDEAGGSESRRKGRGARRRAKRNRDAHSRPHRRQRPPLLRSPAEADRRRHAVRRQYRTNRPAGREFQE